MPVRAGDLIQVQVPGFPLWPGFVIPLRLTPDDVKRQREALSIDGTIPVSFINDETFYWVYDDEKIKYLTKDKIKQRLKLKGKYGVLDAFKAALSLLETHGDNAYEVFLREKELLGPDEEFVPNEVIGELNGNEEEREKEVDGEVEEEVEEDDKDNEKEEEDDDDEEVGHDEVDQETQKLKKKLKQPNVNNKRTKSPSSKPSIKKARKKVSEKEDYIVEDRKQLAINFRAKLQRGLIQRKDKPTADELLGCSTILEDLEKFSEDGHIDSEILKFSKIHKVLKAITKQPGLERSSDFKFHTRSIQLLLKWEDFIREIRKEKVEANTNGSNEGPNDVNNGAVDNSKLTFKSDNETPSQTEFNDNGYRADSEATDSPLTKLGKDQSELSKDEIKNPSAEEK
ncbi:hypothetical protein WICMUC_001307 [Wickerhamomyces mucosus]|uniref:PWWP domain-containing protein n=1 Tax=Wickerhamomyces mucosus TaxID=1378264 RepID=A0A9P8TGS0_9ASCO|nr:hypothetical protein WICMUC_001307 [Wickerhamomyces mucosus]